MKNIGIYIHIPFCIKKCYYCDFISFDNKKELVEEYVKTLIKEILDAKKDDYLVETIYIGGGTPSSIDSKYIIEILSTIKENYNIKENAEITIEINPGTINKIKLENYKNAGINRLSIGLQSTNNKILKEIGRIHTFEEFEESYNLAKSVGFDNINIDLIFGIPNQTIKDIEKSIIDVLKLKPKHISTYSLIVEENTKMKDMIDSKELVLPEDKFERKMYWLIKRELETNGYKHYEISNFAIPGYESKHNLDCWNQKEYLGFGVAAHSYIDNKRFSNVSNIEDYLKNYSNKIIEEEQNREEKAKEFMMLGLRKIEGVSISEFERKFNLNPLMYFRFEIQKLTEDDLIEVDLDNIKLTKKGLDFANLVWREFV